MYPIKESFSWLSPEMTVNDAPGEKVIIRGPALFSVEKHLGKGISRNQRKYIQDEIIRSARTLKNAVIDVNHEISGWEAAGKRGPKPHGKGHVIFGEEENGVIEYTAEINDKIYMQKVRDTDKVRRGRMTENDYYEKWGKKPLLGVSVDADYIHLKCSKCGERFYDAKEYENHMKTIELEKNFQWEPHGIIFKRLSLVEPPESPGVIGTGFEVLETSQKGMSKLLETVVSVHKRQEKTMPKKKPKTTEIPYRTKNIVEQEEHGCKEDEHWDGEKCVKNEQATEQETPSPPCAEGWHEEDGKCVKDETVAEQEISLEAPIAADISVETPAPVEAPTPIEEPEALPPPPLTCGDGFHLENGACVPDEEVTAQEPEPEQPPPATETLTLQFEQPKITLPKILRLGEPFAGYTDFDDCTAKNADKDDPAAYCADIKRKTEGETFKETAPNKDVYERIDLLYNMSKKRYDKSVERDVKLAESINRLNRAVAQLSTVTPKMTPTINTTLNKLQTQVTEKISKVHDEIVKLNAGLKTSKEYNDKKLGQLATTQGKTDSLAKLQDQRIKEAYKHIKINRNLTQQLAKRDTQIAESMKATTKDFEKILSVADKNALEDKNQIKTLEQRVQEMEKQDKEKSVTETTKLIERFDNLEHMLKKGSFKASSPPLESSTSNGKDRLGEKTPYEK